MCLGGSSPSAPAPPPKAPEAAQTPVVGKQASSRTAGSDAARRAKAGGTGSGTILTSSSGVTSSGPTAVKTLLGS